MEITVNSNIGNTIVQILDAFAQKMGVAFDWTAENVFPKVEELCGKYINYTLALDTFIICFASLPLLIILAFGIINKVKKSSKWSDYKWMNWTTFLIVSLMIFIPVVIVCGVHIIECIYFPEKRIFAYLKNTIIPMLNK